MHSFEAIKSEPPHYQEVLFFYKTDPCPTFQLQKSHKSRALEGKCPQTPCYNYHNYQERRRPVFDQDTRNLLYEPRLCSKIQENGKCEEEDECRFSHSMNEIYYHPLYYKTEPCQSCQNPEVPRLCPQYHADEANRTLLLEKFKLKEGHPTNGYPGHRGFNLDTFKVKACTIKGNHNPKVCDFYHFEKDRRRPPSVYSYSTTMCQYAIKDLPCPNGENCGYCHNKVEELYHPERYKRKFCLCHPHNIHKCEYGDYCSFAHSEEEIKIELLHNIKKDEQFYMYKYKTVFCPYIYSHDRNQCVYAHNPQDFRRDPKTYQYNPVQCKNWSQGQIYSYEEGGCPKVMDCECCHGWKELEYHPLYYRTKNCSNFKNCTKVDCPFLHQDKDSKDRISTANQPRNLSMGTNRDFGFASPNKPTNSGSGYHNYSHDSTRSNFYSQFKVKSDRKKDNGGHNNNYNNNYRKDNSHFPGPIMPPPQQNYFKRNEGGQEGSFQRGGEPRPYKYENGGSTRPNSNASNSTLYHEDSGQRKDNQYNNKNKKKNNKKPMSLNEKKEEPMTKSPLSEETQRILSGQIDWSYAPSSEEKGRKDFGKFSGTKTNDSFESLQSYTIEKFGTPTTEKSGSNDQFKKGLINALQKRGLEYTIPILMSPGADIEGLKSFSQKEFAMYPQIKTEDKEKIVPIIRRLAVDDEAPGMNIINPFHTTFETLLGETQWGGANLDFLDSNTNLDFTKHPFS